VAGVSAQRSLVVEVDIEGALVELFARHVALRSTGLPHVVDFVARINYLVYELDLQHRFVQLLDGLEVVEQVKDGRIRHTDKLIGAARISQVPPVFHLVLRHLRGNDDNITRVWRGLFPS